MRCNAPRLPQLSTANCGELKAHASRAMQRRIAVIVSEAPEGGPVVMKLTANVLRTKVEFRLFRQSYKRHTALLEVLAQIYKSVAILHISS